MTSYVTTKYLALSTAVRAFMEDKRGSQLTEYFGFAIFAVVALGLVIGAVRIFWPQLWADITTNINDLWNP